MLNKIINWLKTIGAPAVIKLLPLAEPYLVEQIKKVEGKIGDTPEEKAHFMITHVANFLKQKLGVKDE